MEYQLVLQFPATDELYFEKLIDLEDEIAAQIGDDQEVDGHDFGSGEMNLFIFTNNASEAFERVRSNTTVATYPGLKAAFRHVESEEFTLLWPNGVGGTLSVL